MERNYRIIIFFAVLVVVLAVAAAVVSAALGAGIALGNPATKSYRVSCDGTIDVPAVDTAFTDPKIKANSCQLEVCSRLGFSIFGDPFAQNGNVQLVVNGQVLDSASWSSSLGADQDYQLQTSCITKPSSVTVQVRDSENRITDHKDEVFS